jgi:excinuclease ABC subunit A
MWAEAITIRGARQHNLRNLDLAIPKAKFTVIGGVSGSGKSSLAFDTLYAEGQRSYVESLSTYARQFLERLEKPDVDGIEGIQPAIAIRQRNSIKSSRSTVGTATEVYDYLRLLYARIGVTVCPDCNLEVRPDSPDLAVTQTRERFGDGTRLLVTFPAHPTETLPFEDLAPRLVAQGYLRARWKDEVRSLEEPWAIAPGAGERLDVVADRLVLGDEDLRLAEAIEAALHAGEGKASVIEYDGDGRIDLDDAFACSRCGRVFDRPTPQLFSFNNPQGACESCNGFGERLEFDELRIVPDLDRTLANGAIKPWASAAFQLEMQRMLEACRKRSIPADVPFRKLKPRQQKFILEAKEKDYLGIVPWLSDMRQHPGKEGHRFFTRRYMARSTCRACGGCRLAPSARAVKVGGREIGELCAWPVPETLAYLQSLSLQGSQRRLAADVLTELVDRLQFLVDIGLGYLSLDRASRTLSGGEMQRIHLSNALGSHLVETLYVLDEPSIGLHASDTHRLIQSLHNLARMGNTVVVVEHDNDVLEACDHLIDLGPGAGAAGGQLLYEGPPPAPETVVPEASLTCQYLAGRRRVPLKSRRRPPGRRRLTLTKARRHNLKDIDVVLPLGLFVCVSGVSGSGKSTLVNELLYPALMGQLSGGAGRQYPFDALHGTENVEQVVLVDQSPIGRSARSNPATYMQLFGEIRELLAAAPLASQRGWTAGRFSFNVAGGRCPNCHGMGEVTVEMQFMADMTVPCDECNGKRFEESTLEVRYRGRNVSEILDLTVDEAITFFTDKPSLGAKLWLLQRVGLGYLQLGQPASTLSGGESQRIKIARELLGGRKGHHLYLLDEPTTGLHAEDVRKLLKVLDDLVDEGHTVLVIEHNLDVLKNADHVIDLGPGGGPEGGELVVAGPPESLVENPRSITGRYLAPLLPAALEGRS